MATATSWPTIELEEIAEVLEPRAKLTVAEWARARRVLRPETSARPGRWDHMVTPHMVEPMVVWSDPTVRRVTIRKCAQAGGTELANNIIGRTIDEDPYPMLVVMPVEADSRRRIKRRLRPMFVSTPSLLRHLGGNIDNLTDAGAECDNCYLYTGWATSPAALADNPVAIVLLDEIDKYPARAGKEADPVSLAEKRQRTFWAAKTLTLSTPTDQHGVITREYDAGDRRQYWIPCAMCGAYHVPIWANVELDKDADGNLLAPELYAAGERARYRCPECGEAWTQADRGRAVCEGIWAPEGCTVVGQDAAAADQHQDNKLPGYSAASLALASNPDAPGEMEPDAWILAPDSSGPGPDASGEPGNHRSYQINALMLSPAFVTVAELAERWAKAQIAKHAGDLGPLIDFVNSELGLPWEDAEAATEEDTLRRRIESRPAGQVPAAAVCLTAGVDVQEDHFYVTVWAWAFGWESWLISAQRVETWEVVSSAIGRTWPRGEPEPGADPGAPGQVPAAGGQLGVSLAFVDSGYKAEEVYDFCRRSTVADVRPSKGMETMDAPYRSANIEYFGKSGRPRPWAVRLWHINTSFFKDRINRLMGTETPGPGYLHLPRETDEDLLGQMCSEHKRVIRRGRRIARVWVKRPDHPRNHYWDCAVLAAAAAQVIGVANLADPGAPAEARRPMRRVRQLTRFRR